MAELEYREKQYDRREYLDVFVPGSSTPACAGALTYIASDSPANVNWLGPAPMEALAETIATSRGPSGPNSEYLLRLVSHLREMGVTEADDPHCFELEQRVLQKLAGGAGGETAKRRAEPAPPVS